ncbi:MAG: MMPL family transporter [Myxococcota bacterium]
MSNHTAFDRLRDAIVTPLVETSVRRPFLILSIASVFAVACVGYAVTELEVKTDRNALIREGRDWNERFEAYRNNYEGTRDLIVVLKGPRSQRDGFADALAERVREFEDVEAVFHRVDPALFERRSLLYLDEKQIAGLKDALRENRTGLLDLTADPSLDGTLKFIDRRISQSLVSNVVGGLFGDDEEEGSAEETEDEDDTIDLSFVLKLLHGIDDALAGEEADPDIWSGFLGGGGKEDKDSSGYLLSADRSFSFVIVTPREGADGRTIRALEDVFQRLADGFPDVEAGITGQRAINYAETRATVQDTQLAGLIALVGVALVFTLGFGRVTNPLLAVAALMFGIAWSTGSTTLFVGHLTVLTVPFVSILVGLGIDFGIHVVSRYEEAMAHMGGGSASRDHVPQAVTRAAFGSAPGNVAGAATTAMAFYGVGLSDFLGVAELGIIAGTGVLLCLLSSLTVLPALMVVVRSVPKVRPVRPASGFWARLLHRRTAWTGVVLAVVAAIAAPQTVGFDSNLLHLQAEGVEAVELELELVEGEGQSSAFAVVQLDSLEAARAFSEEVSKLEVVARVESVAQLIPPDQSVRGDRARTVKPFLEGLETDAEPRDLNLKRLSRRIEKLKFKLRPEKESSWDEAKKPEQAQLQEARALLERLSDRLAGLDAAPSLVTYQDRVAERLNDQIRTLKAGTDPLPIAEDDIPVDLTSRLIGRDGRYLVRIYPTVNIWDPEPRLLFINEVAALAPDVTGIPVQSHYSSNLMRNGYIEGGIYSLIVVLVILALDLRRPRWIATALIPLVIGGGWTLGAMSLTGLQFNLANLVIVPLMIGIGIDIGIHMTHRNIEDGSAGADLVKGSTGRAVLLSGLTTAIGFGSLAIAQHQGIQSLGLLLAIGVSANVLSALFVLAPLLPRGRAATSHSSG